MIHMEPLLGGVSVTKHRQECCHSRWLIRRQHDWLIIRQHVNVAWRPSARSFRVFREAAVEPLKTRGDAQLPQGGPEFKKTK